jgi:hypothetical protein
MFYEWDYKKMKIYDQFFIWAKNLHNFNYETLKHIFHSYKTSKLSLQTHSVF